jgi:hypothetical protein
MLMICPVPLLLSIFYTPSLVLLYLLYAITCFAISCFAIVRTQPWPWTRCAYGDSSDGLPDVSDSTRELDFFFKLDDKRYRGMLQYYRNRALDNDANAYPQTLSAAYRTASGSVIDEKEHRGYRDPPEVQSAFVRPRRHLIAPTRSQVAKRDVADLTLK